MSASPPQDAQDAQDAQDEQQRPWDPDWPMPFAQTRVRALSRDERRRMCGYRLPGPLARWPRHGRPPWLRAALRRSAFGLPPLALAVWSVGLIFGGAPLWLYPPVLAGFALALGFDAAEQARRDALAWGACWRRRRRELRADLQRGVAVERRFRFLDCKVVRVRVRDHAVDLMYVFKLDERHCYVAYHGRPEGVAEGDWQPPPPRRGLALVYLPRQWPPLASSYEGEAFERAPLGWVHTVEQALPAPFGVWEAVWDEVERRLGCTAEDPGPQAR